MTAIQKALDDYRTRLFGWFERMLGGTVSSQKAWEQARALTDELFANNDGITILQAAETIIEAYEHAETAISSWQIPPICA